MSATDCSIQVLTNAPHWRQISESYSLCQRLHGANANGIGSLVPARAKREMKAVYQHCSEKHRAILANSASATAIASNQDTASCGRPVDTLALNAFHGQTRTV